MELEINRLQTELKEVMREYKQDIQQRNVLVKKVYKSECRQRDINKEIKRLQTIVAEADMFTSVSQLEGYTTLAQDELIAISTGLDKTDYRTADDTTTPRFIDLEKVVKEVIGFKQQYPGWILERIQQAGQYDSMPPRSFYQFTYKSPQGHFMSYGGIERL